MGDQPLPPRGFERLLLDRLAAVGVPQPPLKVIRFDGAHALVRIPHTLVPLARRAWNDARGKDSVPLRTLRSYGTLRKGKRWMRGPPRSAAPKPSD